jgi:hypothetical protein
MLNGWGSCFFSCFLGLLSRLCDFRQDSTDSVPGLKEALVASGEDGSAEASSTVVVWSTVAQVQVSGSGSPFL